MGSEANMWIEELKSNKFVARMASGLATHLTMKSQDVLVCIGSILVFPIVFNCSISIGFLMYIFCWKYANKLYHAAMALVVFCWLLGCITVSLRTCSSQWVSFQYLKRLHQCVFEKLSHHLLQLSASNKNQPEGEPSVD